MTKFEGQLPSYNPEQFIEFGIKAVIRELSGMFAVSKVQEMEFSIMNCLDWQVQSASSSEVSIYFLRKFWRERLNISKRPKEFPLNSELQDMIKDFIRRGLLLDAGLSCSYAEIAVAAVAIVFLSLSMLDDGINFIAWILDHLPISLVLLDN